MNARLLELAVRAGAEFHANTIIVNGKDADDFVKKFDELVRQDEREACAKLCEGRWSEGLNFEGCSAAIRARGEK